MIDMELHAFTDLTDSALAELSQYEGLDIFWVNPYLRRR